MLTTINEVIATGLRVSTIDQDDTLPDIAEAIEKHIKPVLGQSLIDALNAAYVTLQTPPPPPPEEDEAPQDAPEPPAPALVALLPYVQKPLAAFAYLDELPASHARITSAGVRRTATDGMPTAYRWEYEKVEAYLEERAYRTMDTLMLFLTENASDYTDWTEEALINDRKALLVKSGKDLQDRYPVQYPYLTWFRFLPFLRELTETYLIATFGRGFYNELMGVTNNDATTDPASESAQYLLFNLQMALVNITIHQAASKGFVSVSGIGMLTIKNGSNMQAPGTQAADTEQLNRLAARCMSDGKMYLRRAINFANEKASSTLFNTYYTSDQYTAPSDKIIDRKNDKRKIFRM